MHEPIFQHTHLDPVLLQLLSSVVCHKAVLALRLLTKVVILPAGNSKSLTALVHKSQQQMGSLQAQLGGIQTNSSCLGDCNISARTGVYLLYWHSR